MAHMLGLDIVYVCSKPTPLGLFLNTNLCALETGCVLLIYGSEFIKLIMSEHLIRLANVTFPSWSK